MVTTPTPPPTTPKVSKVEGIKERSQRLREPVATEILQDTTHFSEDGLQILKFHGSYQQDNRDNRVKGQEKDYQFMLRTRNPGGYVPPQLYLALDRLADQYGNHTLRATTRQGFQLHGVLKQNLKTVLAEVIRNLGSTLGACGDLNRNVMAPPAPFKNRPEYQYAMEYANNIADLLTPQTGAYYEIWLDGEKAISAEPKPEVMAALQRNGNGTIFHDSEEPIYGDHYMPRKFKCCVTVPGDNSVDLFSQDVSLVVITNEQGELQGFNVYAGGGLGRTHNNEETFARIADPIGYVEKADVYDLVKAIVATQRNYGDRHNRRHARMKYLLHDWGVNKFRQTVEGYFGKAIQPMQPTIPFKYEDFLGWHEQGDGKLFLGISVQNGRVQDEGSLQLKTALREIVETYSLPIFLTPNHNIIVPEIDPAQKDAIQAILDRCGVQKETDIDPLVRYAMACPALPTCGLAVTESERAIPAILDRIRLLLDKVGLPQEYFVTRMTGCPNGCARPYLAELGFVGQKPGCYQLWLGADPNQTRLSEPYLDSMPIENLETTLEPLFVLFKQQRQANESFGDFCHRVGFDSLRNFATTYVPETVRPDVTMLDMTPIDATAPDATALDATALDATAPDTTGLETTGLDATAPETAAVAATITKSRHRIGVRNEVYDRLKAASIKQGKPMSEIVNAALELYLQSVE